MSLLSSSLLGSKSIFGQIRDQDMSESFVDPKRELDKRDKVIIQVIIQVIMQLFTHNSVPFINLLAP